MRAGLALERALVTQVVLSLSLPSFQYTLIRDVVSSLRRHRMHEQQFNHPPLLILNSFGTPGMHVKLMATMFQNLFPSINVHTVSQIE